VCSKSFNGAVSMGIRSEVGLRMSKKAKSDRASRRKRVFLVDQHALMRFAAAEWITRSSGLTVCGMADGVPQTFKAVERLRPDVVVSEIMRPDSLAFIRKLHDRFPRVPIVVFSIQDAAVYAARAREAGASGFLMKDAGLDRLIRTIWTVFRGRKARAQRMTKRVR
jgi:DNA-binding NarL/FixJ family response regulator